MKLIVLDAASRDLQEATDYYADRASSAVAARFVEEFDTAARRLLLHPMIGTRVGAKLRSWPLRRFPYTLLYRVDDERVSIVAVANQFRRPSYWKGHR